MFGKSLFLREYCSTDCLSNKKVKVFNTSLLNLNSNEVNEKRMHSVRNWCKSSMADLRLNSKIGGGEVKATWVRDGGLNSLLAAV